MSNDGFGAAGVGGGGGNSFAFVNVVTAFGVDNTGVTDAGPKIQAALNALATTGQVAYFPDGTFLIQTAVTIPSMAELVFATGATFNASLTISGTASNAPFTASGVTSATTTTLNGTPTFGGQTITLASATGFAVGNIVQLRSATYTSLTYTYVIEKLSGTTATLDHPLLMPWASGDTVAKMTSVPTGILIDGQGGATITGTADSLIYLQSAWACVVRGILMTPLAGSHAGLFIDAGGYLNRVERVRVEANGNGATSGVQWSSAILVDSNHGAYVGNCDAKNWAPAASEAFGITFVDCADFDCTNSHANGCQSGLLTVAYNDAAPGCYSGTFRGCSAIANTSAGLDIAHNSNLIKCYGVNASFNGGNGFLIETNSLGVSLVGCTARGNTSMGVNANSDKLSIVSCDFSGGAQWGIEIAAGSAQIVGCTASSANTAGFIIIATGATQVDVLGCDAALGTAYAVYCQNAECHVSRCRFSAGGTVFNLTTSGGLMMLEDVTLTGTSTVGLAIASGATARVGPRVNMTSATTHITNSGSLNRGTVTLNGNSGVAVAFANLNAEDRVILSLSSLGGTGTGLAPSVSYTAGTGFTVTGSVAGDTSVWSWEIP